ncbi:hypothetical protein [Streptomyces rimosus]|uniref:hypothetical protein n=1 Tax=Streptomyces rimosus TaxID=1927 RepID=UPI0004C7614F|nr:hypothetical protein [Streptomyces rimosus]
MTHRTATLRHARKAAAALVIAAAAFGLTACQDGTGVKSAPSTSAVAGGQQSSGATGEKSRGGEQGAPSGTAKKSQGDGKSAPSGTAKKPGEKCTDKINYAGDPRSNAEINSIGEDTGRCPAPKKTQPKDQATPSGTPKEAGKSCTNQINYAGDPRSNAVINSIGEKTGYCPPVQNK